MYHDTEELTKKEERILSNMAIDELLRDQNYKSFQNTRLTSYQSQKFLVNDIIENNKSTLIQEGISTTLYPNLEKRDEAIYNTLFLQSKDKIIIPTSNSKNRERNSENQNYLESKRMYEDMIYNWRAHNVIVSRADIKENIQYL